MDAVVFGLVARECSMNTLIVLRCVSQDYNRWIENNEVMRYLESRCCVARTSSFCHLVTVYNKLLWDGINISLYLPMIGDDYDDKW